MSIPKELKSSVESPEETRARLIELGRTVVLHLGENPGDYAGASRAVGISRAKLMELLERYPEFFADIEEQYFDKLTSLFRRKAIGMGIPEEYKEFDIFAAKTLLGWKQQEEKQKSKRASKVEKMPVIDLTAYHKASASLEQHLQKVELITEGGDNGEESGEEDSGEGGSRGPEGGSGGNKS